MMSIANESITKFIDKFAIHRPSFPTLPVKLRSCRPHLTMKEGPSSSNSLLSTVLEKEDV